MSKQLLKKYNIKLYPIYKMFSWDLLFYYAIIYLFLTIEKGFSASSVLIADACYQFSRLIFQLPCIKIVDILKTRRSLIVGNILVAISIILLIFANTFKLVAISYAISAIGFNLKQLCESTILYDSIKKNKKRNYLFSKVDGHSLSYYYYTDAFSAFFTGFLFVINCYLPLILCFTFLCISIYLAFKFEDTFTEDTKKTLNTSFKKSSTTKYLKQLKSVLSFIIKSKRLRSLLLFSGLFASVLNLVTSLRSIVFTEINLPEKFFGIILAGCQILSAISSKQINLYQNKFKNKILTYISFSNIIPFILVGLCISCNIPAKICVTIIAIWLCLYSICKGPYYTSIKRYLSSFVSPSVNTKIYSVQIIIDSICCTCFSLFSALLLSITSISITLIILGIILLILFIFLLDYMKSHVGLNAKEYPKNEITYIELK